MSVTVGRLEYQVGADGRILERELRGAAKKGGKKGGETLNDEMIGAFKRKWGGPSGFAATLSQQDQKVLAHFNRLGKFTSKIYADRFAKELRPRYQATAKKLVDLFNKTTANGMVFDLSRTFKNGPELQAQVTKARDLMLELRQAFALGLADKPANFDIGSLNRYVRLLDDFVKSGNTELVVERQHDLNDALEEGLGPLLKIADAQDQHTKALDRFVPVMSRAARGIGEYEEEVRKLVDAGEFIEGGRVIDPEGLANAARENLMVRRQLEAQQVKEIRLQREAYNAGKRQLDIEEELQRSGRFGTEIKREETRAWAQHNREMDNAAAALRAAVGPMRDLDEAETEIVTQIERFNKMDSESIDQMRVVRFLMKERVDLTEDLIVVQAERLVQEYEENKAEKEALKLAIQRRRADRGEIQDDKAKAKAKRDRLKIERDVLVTAEEQLVAEIAANRIEIERIGHGRDLAELRNDEMDDISELLQVNRQLEDARWDNAIALDAANQRVESATKNIRYHTGQLLKSVDSERLLKQTLGEVNVALKTTRDLYQRAGESLESSNESTRAQIKLDKELAEAKARVVLLTEQQADAVARLDGVHRAATQAADDVARANFDLDEAEQRKFNIGTFNSRFKSARQNLARVTDELAAATAREAEAARKAAAVAKEQTDVEKELLKTRTEAVTVALHDERLAKAREKFEKKQLKNSKQLVETNEELRESVEALEQPFEGFRISLARSVIDGRKLVGSQEELDAAFNAQVETFRKLAAEHNEEHGSLTLLRIAAGEAAESTEKLVAANEELGKSTKGVLQTKLEDLKATKEGAAVDEAVTKGKKKAAAAAEEQAVSLAGVTDATKKAKKATKELDDTVTEAVKGSKAKAKAEQDTAEALEKSATSTVKMTAAQKKANKARAEAAEKDRQYYTILGQIEDRIANKVVWQQHVERMGSVARATEDVTTRINQLADFAGKTWPQKFAALNRSLQAHVKVSEDAAVAAANTADATERTTAATDRSTAATDRQTASQEKAAKKTRDNEFAQRRLAEAHAEVTRLIGDKQAWDRLVKNMGSVDAATTRVEDAFYRLETRGGPGIARTLAPLQNRLLNYQEAAAAAAGATDKVTDAFGRGGNEGKKLGSVLDRLGEKFKNIGTRSDLNPRAIAAIIAVLGEPIAVLGGALGPAVLAVASAAGAAVAGVGAMVAVFSVLGQEVEDLPDELQDVAKEFGGLKTALGNLRLEITHGAFSEMQGTFSTLEDTVDKLTPAFQVLGQSVGKVFAAFAKNTREGTTGFGEIERFVLNAGPMFESLADSAGTFLLSLLTGFRKAQPMTDAFLQWIQDLANEFDAFVQGRGFDEWLGHSMEIFGALNRLLDATGTMLNNLVTDESVARTAAFIDNLAAFAPHLENIISFFGELDVLGLISQLLVEVGDALLPVLPMFEQFAEVLGEKMPAIITGFADAAGGIGVVLGGIATGIASVLDVMSPRALEQIATSLTAIGAGLLAITAVRGLAAMTSRLGKLLTSLLTIGAQDSGLNKTSTALGRMAGKAAGLATLGVALFAVADAIVGAIDNARGVSDMANDFIAGGATIEQAMLGIVAGSKELVENQDEVLARLADTDNFWVYVTALDGVGQEAVHLAKTLEELDPGLTALAQHDMSAASAQFSAYATQLGATGNEVLALLEKTTGYKQVVTELAIAEDGTASSADLIRIALGGVAEQLEVVKTPLQENADIMARLKEDTGLTAEEVDNLAESIRNFGSAELDTRESARQYQQAIIDLTDDLKENGVQTDITTQLGIDQQGELDTLVEKTNNWAASVFDSTGDQEEANRVLGLGRQALIDMYQQFDPAGLAAGEYNDELGLIPTDIQTLVKIQGEQEAKTAAANITTSINGIKDKYVKVYITPTVTAMRDGNGNLVVNGAVFGAYNRGFAAGGIAKTATPGVFGEAGAEALVPLNRPLNRVDPSVRALSAIAQGLAVPRMASGGIVGGGRTLNIAPGAIQIQGTLQPEAVATNTVNRIAERLS